MNNKIEEILRTYTGEDTDLCYYIFDILNNSENPGRGLGYFMEKIRTRSSDKTYQLEKKFSTNELQQLDSIYSKYIDELLVAIVNKAHLSKWNIEEFYDTLWKKISTDILFDNERTKAFVLFKVAQNPLMPYVEIESPLSMSNEKFSEICEKNEDLIIKIKHILSLDFNQKTEIASLILNEIQKNKSFEEQSVILGVVLYYFQQSKVNELMLMQMSRNANVELEQNK